MPHNVELRDGASAPSRLSAGFGAELEKMMGKKAIMGIHPNTKCCEVVATDEPANWMECRDMGLIVVQVPMEKAKASWGEVIEDVYALAAPNAAANPRA